MNREKQQGLIVGAITAIIAVFVFLAMGNSTAVPTEPTSSGGSDYWLIGVAALIVIAGGAYLYTQSDIQIQVSRPAAVPSLLTEGQGTEGTEGAGEYQEQIRVLFGTSDIAEITQAIEVMYKELEQRRNQPDQSQIIDKLRRERDQARRLADRWQAKSVQQKSQVELLHQPVTEKDLTDFWPTVEIDGNAFLSSKRRHRRLLQRLRVEGIALMKKSQDT